MNTLSEASISKEHYMELKEHKKFIYVAELKKIAVNYGLSIKGLKKKQLIEILDAHFIKPIVINNEEDFYSLEPIVEIDKDYLFVVNENGFHYGFDVRSFKKLIGSTKQNPYTRTEFSGKTIDSFDKRCKELLNKNKSLYFDEPANMTLEQKFNQKLLRIFQKMDSLEVIASGTQIRWFTDLTFLKLKKLYVILEDVWNYRSQISDDQKNKIVPGNNIFNYSKEYILNLTEYDKRDLEEIILNEMDKLISSSDNKDDRVLGCYYILIALSEVNLTVLEACPWLIQY